MLDFEDVKIQNLMPGDATVPMYLNYNYYNLTSSFRQQIIYFPEHSIILGNTKGTTFLSNR
jgi:hypothetical protein